MTTGKLIAVIGGGSAGMTAAQTAARLGARVVWFLGDHPARASLCINAGCMPSKALFQPIDEWYHVRRRGWFTRARPPPARLIAHVVAWKDREIARFRADRQAEIRRAENARFLVVRAPAQFLDPHTLIARGRRYRADAIILATGSTPVFPLINGLDSLRGAVWTSADILRNRTRPASLAVIGGGPVGVEFAQRYARLGTAVTIFARTRLLPRFAVNFAHRLATIYEREGARVLTRHTVTHISRNRDGWFVLESDGPDGGKRVTSRRVLLAAGRRPTLDGLRLEAAGVTRDERGHLSVGADLRLRGQPHILAAGDVLGRRMVVHQAHRAAALAAANAVTDGRHQWRPRADLAVVFSDPELAVAGLTAAAARRAGHRLVTARVASRDVGKLHFAGDDAGFGELIADAADGRLLGAGLLCDDASNLIHWPACAIEHRHAVQHLAGSEFYHPTKIEIVADLIDELGRKLSRR